VSLWLKFDLSAVALAKADVFVAGIRLVRRSLGEGGSIKNNKLCETNPISERPKMNLSHYTTGYYDDKSGLLTMAKQSQNKPKFTRHSVWRANPTCPERSRRVCGELVEGRFISG
jgi:hypothetical protein